MKLILLLTILLALSARSVQAEDTIFAVSEWAVATGHALDATSSQRCLGEGRCVELNPWLARFDDPIPFTLSKFAVGGLGLWATRKLHTNHPRWASVINFSIGGAFTAIAIRNSRIGK